MEAWVAGGFKHRHYPKVGLRERCLKRVVRQIDSTRQPHRRAKLILTYTSLLVRTLKEADKWGSSELLRSDHERHTRQMKAQYGWD